MAEREVTTTPETPTGRERKPFDLPARSQPRTFREGTRRADLIAMLFSGATFEQVQDSFGWTYRNTHNQIRLLHVYHGFGVREDDEGRIFIFE